MASPNQRKWVQMGTNSFTQKSMSYSDETIKDNPGGTFKQNQHHITQLAKNQRQLDATGANSFDQEINDIQWLNY